MVCICSHHDHSLWLSTTLQYQTDDYRLSLYTCCNIYAEEHVASIEYPILNKLCTSLAFFFPLPPSDFAMQMQVLPFHVSTRQMGWIRERVNCNFRSCHLCVGLYCNLSKIDPPLKISLHVSPFLIEVVAKGVFPKVRPPCHRSACCYVKQEPPKRQYCARGGTNKGRQSSFA